MSQTTRLGRRLFVSAAGAIGLGACAGVEGGSGADAGVGVTLAAATTPGAVEWVDVVQNLRDMMVPEVPPLMIVTGHARAGDGRGGVYRHVIPSGALPADDGGLYIRPASGRGPGVWERVRQPVFDVTAFGAQNDDTGNQDLPIARCVEAVRVAGGGTVLFPSGRYRVVAPIALPADVPVRLVGEGPRLTRLVKRASGHGPVLDLTAATTAPVVIEGMTIFGGNGPASGCDGIDARGARRLVIRNVQVEDAGGAGIALRVASSSDEGCEELVLESVDVGGSRGDGILVERSRRARISGARLHRNSGSGLSVCGRAIAISDVLAGENTIHGLHVIASPDTTGVDHAAAIVVSNVLAHDNVVNGLTFLAETVASTGCQVALSSVCSRANGVDGLRIHSDGLRVAVDSAVIQGNWGYGLKVLGRQHRVTVAGAELINNGAWGVLVSNDTANASDRTSLACSGCIVRANRHGGVRVAPPPSYRASVELLLTGCTIADHDGGPGVYATNDGLVMSGCSLLDNRGGAGFDNGGLPRKQLVCGCRAIGNAGPQIAPSVPTSVVSERAVHESNLIA